jgi:hypothetical protein
MYVCLYVCRVSKSAVEEMMDLALRNRRHVFGTGYKIDTIALDKWIVTFACYAAVMKSYDTATTGKRNQSPQRIPL